MGLDKFKAKKGYWRTPEKTIFTITLLGGGVGTVAGMYVFRHKTKKLAFTIGLPTILITEIGLVIYFLFFYAPGKKKRNIFICHFALPCMCHKALPIQDATVL